MTSKRLTPKLLADTYRRVRVGAYEPEHQHRDTLADGVVPGLSIVIGRRSMSWYVFYRVSGSQTRRGVLLGRYPDLSIAEARKAARAVRARAQIGEDVGHERQVAKRSATIADLLDEYHQHKARSLATGEEVMRLLRKDMTPALLRTRVQNLTRRQVVLHVDGIRARSPSVARSWQARMVHLMRFAAERGHIDINPLERMAAIPAPSRDRLLTDSEIRTLWRNLDRVTVDPSIVRVLRLLLATGVRVGEAVSAEWSDVAGGLWTIPATKTKNRRVHEVPLPPLAVEIMGQRRAGWVFPGRDQGHISTRAISAAVRRNRGVLAVDNFHPHDLRRVVRSHLSAMGVAPHIAESVLGHIQHGVVGVYDRHSYRREVFAALCGWCDRLLRIVGGKTADVVPIQTSV